MENDVSESVRALAEADFTHVADSFENAGFQVRLPARGILQLSSGSRMLRRPRLLLSVGVHGDETAPIELVGRILAGLAAHPRSLALDLMVVVGNPAAIAAGKRFIDVDLNRLFRSERGELQSSREAERADVIMRASASFFAGADAEKWHLDLHTAIRPSRYPTFAVVPVGVADLRRQALLGVLGRAGIAAAILNTQPASTFSAYTAASFGAASATLELGQVGALGSNDLSRFEDTHSALEAFMRTGRAPGGEGDPQVFRVVQELVKRTDNFQMALDAHAENFTPFEPGSIIAQDGDLIYRAGERTEHVVFPNPAVRPGFRAGLMVVREES